MGAESADADRGFVIFTSTRWEFQDLSYITGLTKENHDTKFRRNPKTELSPVAP